MEKDIHDTGSVPPQDKPLDSTRSYKGHPQPPVDERLEQAKNFLADEDIDRCLNFTSRLDEIEEYVSFIKDEKLECDPDSLKDVEIMIKVHRDWLYRTQERPYVDSNFSNSIPIQNYSSRLLCADTAAGVRRQREQYGIVTQMRNDHPPFTVKRECDHTQFLKAMTDDATADPDTVDLQTNLLWVEHGAYARALREPAFIQVWLHPTRGLPTRGLSISDEHLDPTLDNKTELPFVQGRGGGGPDVLHWHQETTSEPASSGGVEFIVEGNGLNRPDRRHDSGYGGSQNSSPRTQHPDTTSVPPALIELQNEINTLLPRTTVGMHNAAEATGVELTRLAALLEPFFPPHLMALKMRTAQREIDAVPSFLSFEFVRALSAWLDTFREQGFRIKVTSGGVDGNDGPGDFYVKIVESPTPSASPSEADREQGILELMELRKASSPEYKERYMNREVSGSLLCAIHANADQKQKTNCFTGKAERRGVQRASIELGLNLLATNQEQQRPQSRFRIVQLPPKYEFPLPKEVPLCLPIEPWKRPVEQDPFKYTKIMREYRRWKDHDFDVARSYTILERPGTLPPPANYQGPFSLPSEAEFTEITALRQSYLARLCEKLLKANNKAPRPLLADVLRQVDLGLHYEVTVPLALPIPEFYDEVPLEQKHLDTLMELAEPSWNEKQVPWGKFYNSTHESRRQLARIKEFLGDLEALPPHVFPFATFAANTRFDSTDAFLQPPYHVGSRSSSYATTEDLVKVMNANRTEASGEGVYQWTNEEAENMLILLRDHFIAHHNSPHHDWARIPPTGHPENKYIVSVQVAATSYGVALNTDTNKYEVQYTSDGKRGPAIVQPNKYHFYRQVAFRIGRDIHKLLRTLSNPRSAQETLDVLGENTEYAYRRMEGLPAVHPPTQLASIETSNPKKISLIKIAAELHQGAPDLAVELGWNAQTIAKYLNADESTLSPTERATTEAIAGRLIQNQIIEEANNNWEPRFPENERVWGFAKERLLPITVEKVAKGEDKEFKEVKEDRDRRDGKDGKGIRRTMTVTPKIKQFFSMRRFPYDCQPTWQKTAIKASGPIVQEKPQPVQTMTVEPTEEEVRAKMIAPKPRTRHVQNNQFPFGETAYQRAFMSYQIERDLADVPGFETAARGGSPLIDPYSLPKIPEGWTPTSKSVHKAREEWISQLKASSDGPPILELYHTQAEIAAIKDNEARAAKQKERKQFNKMIEMEFGPGKTLDNLTDAQLAALERKLKAAKEKEKEKKNNAKRRKLGGRRRGGPTDIMTGGLRNASIPDDVGGGGFISEEGDGIADMADTEGGPARNTRSRSPKKKDRERARGARR
ncbi:hypothetical protein B7494_g844 [Chlorociboria aeruginascens]|nr:hypothetical protein B7494_g844 [Chlorociboria aeruginascens]